jgi:hypothetical protein
MTTIKNPNEIVSELVDDYKRAFGESLLGMVLCGSAVTHEYLPGVSDINSIAILKDRTIDNMRRCLRVARKWRKHKVAVPFFMTPEFITSAVYAFPVEFLDIQTSHRILYGEDYFSRLEIDRENLRLHCERELRGISMYLRKEFVGSGGKNVVVRRIALASMKRMLPVFKALLRLHNKPVPKIRSDVVMAIEDLYGLGASSLSGILNLDRQGKRPKEYAPLFGNYCTTVDGLIERVGTVHG